MNKKIKCSECNKKLDYLDVFPLNKCCDCFEKVLIAQEKKGIFQKPDFIGALNLENKRK